MRAMESEDFRRSDELTRAMASLTIERNYDPDAIARHAAAALVTPDLRARLKLITAPTVVIQGEEDPIIPAQLARDVARSIPGAKFVTIDGMAHDVPDVMIGEVVKAILSVAQPEPAPAKP
jgi:pimeloyl-ACP methyl ester carboxylesterase